MSHVRHGLAGRAPYCGQAAIRGVLRLPSAMAFTGSGGDSVATRSAIRPPSNLKMSNRGKFPGGRGSQGLESVIQAMNDSAAA
jgi:hypothetical protein